MLGSDIITLVHLVSMATSLPDVLQTVHVASVTRIMVHQGRKLILITDARMLQQKVINTMTLVYLVNMVTRLIGLRHQVVA